MAERGQELDTATKRRKLNRESLLVVSGKPISPPPARRVRSRTPTPSTPWIEANVQRSQGKAQNVIAEASTTTTTTTTSHVASPFQLTTIQDLAPYQNVDTVTLHDILGDPMIKECWNFNFLFDLDFVMKHFDSDVRDLVKVKIVHGFWKRDDQRRSTLTEAAEAYTNVELKTAYIPDPFGTHHSKMVILFRHDDFAQVIIHTANMIARDWRNMTQAVWRSPLLPFQKVKSSPVSSQAVSHPIGSGERFKIDLLHYLDKYENRLKTLTQQLAAYDFSSIRAAFLGSAPSHQKPELSNPSQATSFGWLGLQEILSTVPIQSTGATAPSRIVTQVSSIATLGQNPTWLAHFQSVLHHGNVQTKTKQPKPLLNIIFPTSDEIRTSLDGYASGGSIHTKIQSPAQQKQLAYLRLHLCHWKSNSETRDTEARAVNPALYREAHRGPAAPHIKTYIRFSDAATMKTIDWAMVTSANLSKQAWGEMVNKKGEVWIQSWETGVVVWPALFGEEAGGNATMVPVFGRDMPAAEDEFVDERETGEVRTRDDETETEDIEDQETEDEEPGVGGIKAGDTRKKHARSDIRKQAHRRVVIGLRMPYDLPLTPYKADEVPWCATQAHTEPDWMGRAWVGH